MQTKGCKGSREQGRKNKQQFQFTTKSISKLKSPGNSNKNSSSSSRPAAPEEGQPRRRQRSGGRGCGFIARSEQERVTDVVRDVDRRKVASALNASLNGFDCRCFCRCHCCPCPWQMSQVARRVINAFGCCILRLKRLLLLCLPHEIRHALSPSLLPLALPLLFCVNNRKKGNKPLAFP